MSVILCGGVFDLLHPGHVAHLEEALSWGSALYIGLTFDEAVNKPGRPIQTYAERRRMLLALRCVTNVIGCHRSADAILYVRPHIFVKGIEYATKGLLPPEYAACAEVGAEIRFTTTPKESTTALIERIKCAS